MARFNPTILPPTEALDYLGGKAIKPSDHWTDVWRHEHATSFTAARMAQDNLLIETHGALFKALKEGTTMGEFRRTLAPRLAAMGWAPPPGGGDVPYRLNRIYDANMRTAYAAGQWQRAQRVKAAFPYFLYQLGPSIVHRDQHLAWEGLILPVDDPFWDTHWPPNGFGCKCHIRQITAAEADRLEKNGITYKNQRVAIDDRVVVRKDRHIKVRRTAPPMRLREWVNRATGEIIEVPEGIGPGWDFNPGKVRAAGVRRAFADHIEKLQTKLPTGIAEETARARIAEDVGGAGFRRFIEESAAAAKPYGRTPVALIPEARLAVVGAKKKTMMLEAVLAKKIWRKHGPESKRPDWHKLNFDDWLEIPLILEVGRLHRQNNGRTAFLAMPYKDFNGEKFGYFLALDRHRRRPAHAVPVTFHRINARDAARIAERMDAGEL